jgi:hypothetical protein
MEIDRAKRPGKVGRVIAIMIGVMCAFSALSIGEMSSISMAQKHKDKKKPTNANSQQSNSSNRNQARKKGSGVAQPKALPQIYMVRITVVDSNDRPVEGVKITSSIDSVPKSVDGQWQLDIPSASVPASRKLTFYASKESAFLFAKSDLVLGTDPRPAITIKLAPGPMDFVRGMVQDESGAALAGARVSVVGYPGETFITKEDGQFVLPAHKATNQQVEIHIEADGFKPYNFHHPAGNFSGVFRLHRK